MRFNHQGLTPKQKRKLLALSGFLFAFPFVVALLDWLGSYPAFRAIVSIGLASAIALLLVGLVVVVLFVAFHMLRGYIATRPPLP